MLVLPTMEQCLWAQQEIGVIIHLDMPTFVPEYIWDKETAPPVSVFCPDRLDTDQWLESAVAAGAKYAVLVAKHCSGFSLWPTKVHGYNVASTSWKNGKGDVVADFIASCKKYGVRPGLYYSASANGYLGINPDTLREKDEAGRAEYFNVLMTQLREIWTNYGELFEIWFDGGVIPVEEGGPDIAALLHELQPNALVFQGPVGTKSLIRWVGNEFGIAPEECSNIIDSAKGEGDNNYAGDTNGDLWMPAETDTPNRHVLWSFQGGWFWRKGEEKLIVPPRQLLEDYIHSVGRSTNLLLGMVIDTHGRFPEKDTAAFRDFGELREKHFGQSVVSVTPKMGDTEITLKVPTGQTVRYLVLAEDIAKGERVTSYRVERVSRGKRSVICENSLIGNKRILPLGRLRGGEIHVTITASKAETQLKSVELY